MRRHRVVRVPGSSANLGPGYDTLAAAVGVYLELEVKECGEFSVTAEGPDGEALPGVALDRSNLCVQAFERLHSADGISFSIRSELPLAAGLGSSGAAIVAGAAAADHLYELDAPLLEVAAELEGHPDNVAASLMGGFVVCSDGRADRFDPAPGLEGVIATPPNPVPTSEARAAVPDQIPLADAVHNIAHSSLLVLGLVRGDLDLVARGLSDRVHQSRRAALYPRSMELLGKAEEMGAIGASISGAGPSVLFWCHWEHTGALVDRLRTEAPDCVSRRVQFVPHGADVREL
ncbi:MAG: homoserine kinase [Thermoleophilaceae bacterium]|nr:homoserine kinase [Thermoleophilaceae bacterium]